MQTIRGSTYSTDDGLSWTQVDNLPHLKAAFASSRAGWSGGANDSVYKWTGNLLVSVKQTNEIVHGFRLEHNYPNPFNPSTTIRYALPRSGHVTLKVYNLLGHEIANLVNEDKAPGRYEARWDASQFASGVYFYRLVAGSFTETKKLVLLR